MMTLRDLMTAQPECALPEEPIQAVAARMRSLDVGSLPVCADGRLAGMITDRDIVVRAVAEGFDPRRTSTGDVMTGEVVCSYDDEDVEAAALIMREHQIRRLPVLDRQEQLVGIVSLGDFATETGDAKRAGEVLQDVSEPSLPRR